MNIYESVRTTPKCKTCAKSQKYSHTYTKSETERNRERENQRECERRLPFVFTLEKLQKIFI